ncbi:MAG: hypothetical protein R3F59_28100 [Myxococcota bacterium]
MAALAVAQDLVAEHVVAALPGLEHDGVAQQPGQHAELLDGAVAAEHLDGGAHAGGAGEARPELVEVHEHAVGAALAVGGLAERDAVAERRQREGHAAGARRGDAQVGELAGDRRERRQGLAERGAVRGVRRGLAPGALQHGRAAHGVEDAARVDDLLEHGAEVGHGQRPGALEVHLGRGHGARAELVLEAADAEGVGAAVVEAAGHDVALQAARAGRRTLGAGGDEEQVGVDDRAEPLLPDDAGGAVAGVLRDDRVGAHVAAALDLGQELRADEVRVVVGVEQARHPVRTRVARVAERLDEARGAGHGAGVAGLAVLREEVHRRDGQALLAGLAEPGHRARGVGQAADLAVGRVVDDALGADAEAVVAAQLRQVLVAVVLAHQRVDARGADVGERLQRVGLPEPVDGDECLEVRIGAPPVGGVLPPGGEVVASDGRSGRCGHGPSTAA